MRTCTICKNIKELTAFESYRHQCRKCRNEIHKNYPGRQGEALRKKIVKRTYNLEWEDYQKMIKDQNNLCDICKNPSKNRALAIDHCHATGKVRALLCEKCNKGLGQFNDNPTLLQKAAEYLIKHKK